MKKKTKILLATLFGVPIVLGCIVYISITRYPIHNIMYGRSYNLPLLCKRSCDYLSIDDVTLQNRYDLDDIRTRAIKIDGISLGGYQSGDILNLIYTSPKNNARHEFSLLQNLGPGNPGKVNYSIYNACQLPNRTLKTEIMTVLNRLDVETDWLDENSIHEVCYASIGF